MRVMVFIKANEDSEAGVLPSEQLLTDMMEYNEELVKAGIMLAGDGLHPSSEGVRINWSGGETTVTDGPFTEAKELVAGYWLWEVRSMEEAIEWAKRIPNTDGGDGEVELRPVFEPDDFGESMTPEIRAKEQELRARTEARQ
jgi:hypothetical protein